MGTRRITKRTAKPAAPSWVPHAVADIHPSGVVYAAGQPARDRNDAIRAALRTLIRGPHSPLVCETSFECFRCGAYAFLREEPNGTWTCHGLTDPNGDSMLTAKCRE